jgi:hypothetical protein
VSLLEKKRAEGYDALWDKVCEFAETEAIDIAMPRCAKRQTKRANAPAETPKEYWKRNLFYPFLDHLISELKDRLCKPKPRLMAQHLLSHNITKLTPSAWNIIKEEYGPVLPHPERADAELALWKQSIEDNTVLTHKDIPETLDETYQLFPNIYSILKVLLTMPVSTSSAERSFSTLRRLKTYLRNTMGGERLTALALMNIHQKKAISPEQVLRDFDSTGYRRIALAFK